MRRQRISSPAIKALLAGLLFLLPGCPARALDSYALRTGGSAVLADAEGSLLVAAGVYGDILRLSDDDLFAAYPLGGKGYGLLNGAGEALTEFIYDQLTFDGEAVIFSQNGLYGAMNTAGQTLVEPLYTRLIPMGEGRYLALKSNPLDDSPDALTVLDASGREKSTGTRLLYGPFAASQSLSPAVIPGGLYGYLNAAGEWAVEPDFLWADDMRFGRARASTEDGMGLIDRQGHWLIEPRAGRLIVSELFEEAPVLCLDETGAALLTPETGAEIARFDGAVNAAFTGHVLCIESASGVLLVDYQGETLLALDECTESATELDGYYIVRSDAQQACPFTLLNAEGQEIGRWQELTFAGRFNGALYAAYSVYKTEETQIGELTFQDEISGTRRYGLIDMNGQVIIDNLTSLKATGRALLTAETDDWIGLIRPDGTIVIRLDKEE